MIKETDQKLIDLTQDGYDRMAKDWAGTRMNFWSELTEIVTSEVSSRQKLEEEGINLLDLGCGNARFYRQIENLDVKYFGCDFSKGLIEQAHKYHPSLNLTVCDARSTPYPDNTFDIIVSFAVVHHLPGRKSQEDFFREIGRLLKPGGTAVVTTWNIWKTRKKKIWLDYIKYKPSNLTWRLGDTMMDFTHHKQSRFVHAFTQRSFRVRARAAGLTVVEEKIVERASKKGCEENFVLKLEKS